MRHNIFYWMSQHLPMSVCQVIYDHSFSFRLWWGTAPPVRHPDDHLFPSNTWIYPKVRKPEPNYDLRVLDSLTHLQADTEEWSAYHEFRKRTDPPPYGQGADE